MYRIVFLSLLAVVSAQIYIASQCPAVQPVDHFNFEAFGSGVWYGLARYPNAREAGGQCSATEYYLLGDRIHMTNSDVYDGELRFVKGTGRLAPDANGSGKLLYNLPYGLYDSNSDYTLWILETDYNNYSINYHCEYDPVKNIRRDLAFIFSRTKNLSPEIDAKIHKFLSESNLIDASNLKWIDFSDEACTVYY